MNLNKTTIYLIIGIIYIMTFKIMLAIFPQLNQMVFLKDILLFLWIVSTFTIVLFAFYFIRDFPLFNKKLNISLICIIIFTSIIIILKLSSRFFDYNEVVNRILFDLARISNSISFIYFIYIFKTKLSEDIFSLKTSIRIVMWGYVFNLIFQITGLVFYFKFILTGEMTTQPPYILLTVLLTFLITNFALLTFLNKFKNISNFNQLK